MARDTAIADTELLSIAVRSSPAIRIARLSESRLRSNSCGHSKQPNVTARANSHHYEIEGCVRVSEMSTKTVSAPCTGQISVRDGTTITGERRILSAGPAGADSTATLACPAIVTRVALSGGGEVVGLIPRAFRHETAR